MWTVKSNFYYNIAVVFLVYRKLVSILYILYPLGKWCNFFVFQSYELRFWGIFSSILIRWFPVSFVSKSSQERVLPTTSNLTMARVVQISEIDFDAIHPTLSLVFGIATGDLATKVPGNQRIGIRAFQNIQNYSNWASIDEVTVSQSSSVNRKIGNVQNTDKLSALSVD